MNCNEAKHLFTPYMDGLLPGAQSQSVTRHLDRCGNCNSHFRSLRATHSLVASVGRKQPPAELASRLRIALARERVRQHQPYAARITSSWNPFLDRVQEALKSFMIPATAGLLSAVLCIGFIIGFFALPSQLSADSNDIPSGLYSPAKLASTPFSILDECGPDSPVMVEAYVDASGRVQDYRIISDEPESEIPKLRPQLDNALIFAQFAPAMAFGKPSPSRVVISFARVNVHA